MKMISVKFSADYPKNDIGVARLFYELHSGSLRFVTEAKAWYAFDGRRWVKDECGHRVMEACKAFVEGFHAYIKEVCPEDSGEDIDKVLLKYAASLSSRKKRESILKDAQSIAPLSLAAFDHDRLVTNCHNGTLDLRTMTLKPHNPADYITKLSRVKYDEKARCPRWERFIGEIMCGDGDTARFLQKALGYALSGDTSEHCFFILHGATTRNGKSTLTETVAHLLGEYARTAQPTAIGRRSTDGAAASPDLARLKGARLVNMAEPEKGLELNAALIKQLTGGDTYVARFLHENQFEFSPEFTIFINTNHLPRVADDTVFQSNRIRLVPFERHFEPSEQDTGLRRLFRKQQNLSAILNWLIEGYRLYNAEGMKDAPGRVTAALEAYKRESGGTDTITAFVAAALEPQQGIRIATPEIYAVYANWARQNGVPDMGNRAFTNELRHRYDVRRDGSVGNVLVGYAVRMAA